uniref:Uncharacterized protein n=1 Tax=Anguilla anguilla TaxID=7936 RepID=A0A0E9T622_ANGAN
MGQAKADGRWKCLHEKTMGTRTNLPCQTLSQCDMTQGPAWQLPSVLPFPSGRSDKLINLQSSLSNSQSSYWTTKSPSNPSLHFKNE